MKKDSDYNNVIGCSNKKGGTATTNGVDAFGIDELSDTQWDLQGV